MEKNLNPYLVTAALECAQQNPSGFTISPDMLTEPTEGYAVASLATQGLHGTVGFLKALAYALEHEMYFGGWQNEDGIWYWDAVSVFPVGKLMEAHFYASFQSQLAFYDISNKVEIRLDYVK
jgi:hypothetical protein